MSDVKPEKKVRSKAEINAYMRNYNKKRREEQNKVRQMLEDMTTIAEESYKETFRSEIKILLREALDDFRCEEGKYGFKMRLKNFLYYLIHKI